MDRQETTSADAELQDDYPLEYEETTYMRWNRKLTRSPVGRFFEIEERNSTFFQELRAGIVCFLTVCYIIPVNAGILTDTGGSCMPEDVCSALNFAESGEQCKFFDPGFQQCQRDFKNNAIASTCIASMIATFLMAMVARMPLAVAPAMGVNAYFTYNVVGYLAENKISYQQGLAAVFIEGVIFILVTVTGLRGALMGLIPKNIMYATAAGIGCFLTFIGLQQAEGLGFVTFDPATLVTLGGCEPQWREHMYTVAEGTLTFENICAGNATDWVGRNALGPPSPNYSCQGGQMQSPTTWLGLCTGVIMVVLMMKDIKAAILIGILFCTFISWIPTHKATYFDVESKGLYNSQIIPGGVQRYNYFRKAVTIPDVSMTAGQLSLSALSNKQVWVAMITFLYLDFLDATSTMFAMAGLVAEQVPGFMDEHGVWPRQMATMIVDGVAIIIGALMGTSPLTVFAESAVGIREGGRTGITSLIVAFGFGVSMFFSPIFASIPPYATGPAIILVGAMMMEHTRYVNWESTRMSVPAFLTIICMPLTYSIAYGIITGLGTNIVLWIMEALWDTALVLFNCTHKTYRDVWLETMSGWYVAFGKEEVLMAELPGYIPENHSRHNPQGGGAGGGTGGAGTVHGVSEGTIGMRSNVEDPSHHSKL